MILPLLSLLWLIAVAFLIASAVVQYSAYEKIAPQEPPSAPAPSVAIIVPARNEERNIARCIQGLVQQNYPSGQMRIFVIDDGSTDRTAAIASEFAGADSRVELIRSSAPPPGWKGKPRACWQGVQSAGDAFEWLCFLDADTAAEPPLLASAICTAEQRHLDMLSLEPFQVLSEFWNRLIMPAGFFFAAFTQDLRRVNDPTKPDAFANGQFILIRRKIYDAVGGHRAVRDEITEDSALARLIKSRGHRIMILGGDRMISTRMYQDLSSLWRGISRTLVTMAGGPARLVIFAAAAILLATVSVGLPLWAWIGVADHPTPASILTGIFASIGSLSMLGVHIGAARYFKIPFWYGVLFPAAYLIGAILAIDSLRAHWLGRVIWKGRVYSEPQLK